MGALIFSGAGWLSKVLGAVVVIAGGLTLAGIVCPTAAKLAGWGFLAVLALAVARFWPYTLEEILNGIEYIYLLRFELLAGGILAIGLPVTYWVLPSFAVGLFDGRGFHSFMFTVWAAFQLAWTIMITARLVLVYGPDRFGRAKPVALKRAGFRSVASFGLLALPIVVVLFEGSAASVSFRKRSEASLL